MATTIDDIQLSELGKRAVWLLTRHRLLTQAILRERYDESESQVRNEIRRLTKAGLISDFPFVGGQRYYRLTAAACRRLGLAKRLSGKLGPQAIKTNFGALHFCSARKPARKLLTDSQLGELLGGQVPKTGTYYLDVNSKREREETGLEFRLAHIYVDCRSDASRLIRKAIKFVKDRREVQAFRELVSRDEFLIAFVTESSGKADAIEEAAGRRDFTLPIRIHVCQELQQL